MKHTYTSPLLFWESLFFLESVAYMRVWWAREFVAIIFLGLHIREWRETLGFLRPNHPYGDKTRAQHFHHHGARALLHSAEGCCTATLPATTAPSPGPVCILCCRGMFEKQVFACILKTLRFFSTLPHFWLFPLFSELLHFFFSPGCYQRNQGKEKHSEKLKIKSKPQILELKSFAEQSETCFKRKSVYRSQANPGCCHVIPIKLFLSQLRNISEHVCLAVFLPSTSLQGSSPWVDCFEVRFSVSKSLLLLLLSLAGCPQPTPEGVCSLFKSIFNFSQKKISHLHIE